MAKYYVLSKRTKIFNMNPFTNSRWIRTFDIISDHTEIIGVFFNREQARARRDNVIDSYVKQGRFKVHWNAYTGQEVSDVFKFDLHDEIYEKSGKWPYREIHAYPIRENVERYYDASIICTIDIWLEEKGDDEG